MVGGGVVLFGPHGRSCKAIDPRVPTYSAGTEHVGFSQTRPALLAFFHQARSDVICSASRRKGELHVA